MRFDLNAPPRWMAHCHCTLCRSAHGAGFVTWIGMLAKDVEIHDADRCLRWYDSSPGAQRGFCGRCGSPLFFRSSRWPGELHIARAQVHAPLELEPQGHVFWSRHVDWARPDPADGLPRKDTL